MVRILARPAMQPCELRKARSIWLMFTRGSARITLCTPSGALLASQSTISRLENAPSKTEAARLAVALLDQFRHDHEAGQDGDPRH